MATQYVAWSQAPLDYTFKSFKTFQHLDSGHAVIDTAFPLQVMTAWPATQGGGSAVISLSQLQTLAGEI